jgi:hypothetical protein
MFVKWKRRPMDLCVGETLSAYLVESSRTPKGPRHKHICYIASIAEFDDPERPGDIEELYARRMLGDRGFRSLKFWETAMENLGRVSVSVSEGTTFSVQWGPPQRLRRDPFDRREGSILFAGRPGVGSVCGLCA